jgi:hypothetical protein
LRFGGIVAQAADRTHLEPFDHDRCRRFQSVDLIIDCIILIVRGEKILALKEIDAPVEQGQHGYAEKAYFELAAEFQFFHLFCLLSLACR